MADFAETIHDATSTGSGSGRDSSESLKAGAKGRGRSKAQKRKAAVVQKIKKAKTQWITAVVVDCPHEAAAATEADAGLAGAVQGEDAAGEFLRAQAEGASKDTIVVVLACFSIFSPTSLQALQSRWLPLVAKHMTGTQVLMVGCKSDLRSKAQQTVKLNEAMTIMSKQVKTSWLVRA